VEIVTIVTGGGILIARRYRDTVNRSSINGFMIMALDTLGNDYPFILFPVLVGMYVRMAVGAHDILLYVHAGVMFGIFFFVAAFAMDFVNLDFTLHVPGKVGNLHMTTVAAVFAVHGIGKIGRDNFTAMAAKTGFGINGHLLGSPKGDGKQYG